MINLTPNVLHNQKKCIFVKWKHRLTSEGAGALEQDLS